MDPNPPPNTGGPSGDGGKKQKSKKSNKKTAAQPNIQAELIAGNDDLPQISKVTITPPQKHAPKGQNQPKKQGHSTEIKPTDMTMKDPQNQSKKKDNFPQMSKTNVMPQKDATKEQSHLKKQNKSKKQGQSNEPKPPENTPAAPNTQTGGANININPIASDTGSTQIDQEIEVYRQKLKIPKRCNPKSGGKLGRQTEIEVNHLPLNLDKLYSKTVYHIDVLFKPELPRRLLRIALEEFNRKHYPNLQFAFDGRKNMYTTKCIKSKTDMVSVLNEDNNRTIDFTIVTSVVKEISMNQIKEYLVNGSSSAMPGEAFQALDIVLKNRPFSLRFTNVGRSFFPVPRNTPVDLGEGMELWKGFFQSPVMGWKPFLNIDVANKGFPKYQLLTSYIQNEMRCDLNSEMNFRDVNKLTSYVKGLKVDFLIPNQPNTKRAYKVIGLFSSAAKFYFDMDNGSNVNVVQYFKSTRNYNIKYPNLPCLHVGKVEKKVAIPIELCTVSKGQIRLKKLTENQTSIMVKNAARPPAERRQTIETCIRDIKYNQDPVLREFGIEVKEQFATVPARVLEQPSLAYGQKDTTPKSGVWRAEKFKYAEKLTNWIVLNLDDRTNMNAIKNFETSLISSGLFLNVKVSPMLPPVNKVLPRNCNLKDVQNDITTFFNTAKKTIELIIVIIPDNIPGVYAIVKQSSELTVGVLTQCIKAKTIYKMNPATASNIMLKINSKLNGINHTLKKNLIYEMGAIVFGADVSHPSPDQSHIPSVAAVAASHDINGSQYNMEWRFQGPKVEIIQDLEDIVYKQLCKFREKTKVIPKKIIYLRDGVSEGQFLQLLNFELIAIRRACLRLHINYNPSITFLVVQKRHHTRMFPKHNMDMDGKFCNVPSGTIVDTQITHPTELDFYLCSHASIQGTARPTKYHLLWDDSEFSEDELEQLTFHLCFLFARCTRAVSYPTPTYYAHLAAFRARSYIENKVINLDRLDEEQRRHELNASFIKNSPMFFV